MAIARGNTALAQAFEVEVEPDPVTYDNVVPMSQRLSLLELNEATCHWQWMVVAERGQD